MKDLPLSLLSRGYGQFIPSDGNRNGRLDVCFTPEDYYIWKSQDTLLRLSSSGCLLTKQESTLPKTYSTRRGALVLYSQGLVTLKNYPSATIDGQHHFGQYTGTLPVQTNQRSTLKEHTLAILNYTNGQERPHRPPPAVLPPLCLPQPPDPKCSLLSHTQQQQPTWEQHVRLKPLSPCVKRIKAQQGSRNEDDVGGCKRKMRLDVFLQIPTVSRNSSPKVQHHSWEHLEKEGAFMNLPCTSLEQTGRVQNFDTDPPSATDTNFLRANQHNGFGGFLPPLKAGQAVSNEWYPVHKDRLCNGALSKNEQPTDHLPLIEETPVGLTRRLGGSLQDAKTGRNTNNLQKTLFLPRLIPDKSEEENGQKQRKEMTGKQHEGMSHKVKGLAFEKGCNILLNSGEECPAPVGLLTGVTGKRGPGRQRSLAFLQNRLLNLQPLCEESGDTNREVVRGLLPLELRDLENGQSVGSLILGPDGEIIQLSMFDNIQYSPQGQALEVLSAEGEKLPWVIMLQPEHKHTEEEQKTVSPLVNPQDHFIYKVMNNDQIQRSAETDPGSARINTDSDTENSKGVKDTQSVTKQRNTRKNPKPDGENIGTMSTHDETQLKSKSSQDTGVKDTDNKVSSSGHLSQSQLKEKSVVCHADVTQNIRLAKAQIQKTMEERKSIVEIKDKEKTTTAKKKKIKSVRPDSNRQNASIKRNEEEKSAVSNSQPISGQKQKEKENADAADTLSSVTKRSKGRKGRTRAEKTNDNREDLDDLFGEEETSNERSKKKGRGILKHKEIISEKTHHLVDTNKANSNQEMNEESQEKAIISNLSTTQKHSIDVNSTQIDKDHFPIKELTPTTDRPSSSVMSLRSTTSGSGPKHSSSQRSVSSSCEGETLPASSAGLSMSRSRLSSCSTVMIPEESLMLTLTKTEVAVTEWSVRNQKDKVATLEAQRAESQRQEEERKRKKQEEEEEEERRQEKREQMEQKMKNELQNERQRRFEELRLKKEAEEAERKSCEEEEQKRERRQQEHQEREFRRLQERRKQMEHFQKKREEEEQRRKAEVEHLLLLEERRLQEENMKLQEMEENERIEYFHKKQEEEEARKREKEEQRRREEEAALLVAQKAKVEEELLAREMELLHQRLSFKRGLLLEAEGLEKNQGISRPWTFSYFTLVQLLGLSSTAEHKT